MNNSDLLEEMEKELEALWAQADDRTKARILAWKIFEEE